MRETDRKERERSGIGESPGSDRGGGNLRDVDDF